MEETKNSRIIKARSLKEPGTNIVYNFDDFHQRCEEHLSKTRLEIRQMVISAQKEIETLKEQAHKDGEQRGRQDGLKQAAQEIQKQARELANQEVTNRLKTILPALQSLASELRSERDQWIAEWEESVLNLALTIAGKLVHRQLEQDPSTSLAMMRGVLELVIGKPRVQVRMNPKDVEILGADAESLIADVLGGATESTLVPDPAVSQGGCLLRTQQGEIDARIETQLERIAEELFQSSREG